MYTHTNFKTKIALKTALDNRTIITVYRPHGLGEEVADGWVDIEGPHSPAAHTWYAEVFLINGVVVKVR